MAVSTYNIADNSKDRKTIRGQNNQANPVYAQAETVQDSTAPLRAPETHGAAGSAARTAVIVTLGGKAQVLTFALDWLLQYTTFTGALPPIERVYSLNFSPKDPRMQTCLGQLRHEFAHWPAYAQPGLRFDSITVRERPSLSLLSEGVQIQGRAIDDSDDFGAADAIWMTTNRLIDALHHDGFAIVLLVTGGPRLIGLQAMSAASLLMASHDKCFHLFTPGDVREDAGSGNFLHSTDPRIRLIEVPLLPMGQLAPGLQAAAAATPQDVIGIRRAIIDAQERARCAEVMQALAPRVRDVLRAFALGEPGLTAASVAKRLKLSIKTVDGYKTTILDECRNAWALAREVKLTHHFLHEKFGPLDAAFWHPWADGAAPPGRPSPPSDGHLPDGGPG